MRVVPCFVPVMAVAASLAGCAEDLGTCEMNAATQVVYAADGTPYYAGQGLVQYGCSEGVCHSEVAVNDARKGAPHGLNFDLRPLTPTSTPANISALRAGVVKVRDEAGEIYGELTAGTMPPGAAGQRPDPAWKLQSGQVANLPGVNTDVGIATVRNWLACGAPVVSGVTGAPADASQIASSAIVPAMTIQVGNTFESVYTNVLAPCAAACHKPGGSYAALDLSTKAIAFGSVVGKAAPGACASAGQLVTPGNCETSVLYKKLTPTPGCGAQMPLGGPYLSASNLDALCQWIKAGAKQE